MISPDLDFEIQNLEKKLRQIDPDVFPEAEKRSSPSSDHRNARGREIIQMRLDATRTRKVEQSREPAPEETFDFASPGKSWSVLQQWFGDCDLDLLIAYGIIGAVSSMFAVICLLYFQ